MKNRILFILVVVLLLSFYSKVSANELCSSSGYTILTVNGIFTDKNGAIENKEKLSRKFNTTYNNQSINFNYIYNPTHLAGVSDLVDVVAQGLFGEKSDYDLTEMLNDASQKLTTQKILLIAHSQGNFYANNFYDKVASQEGGIPKESIGVYSVATPADHVAGGGKYLTSDTDKVIASTVGRFINILKPNIHIPLQKDDGEGHSFSDVYLKYQADRIVSDIKSSLNNLKENDEQDSRESCISAPKLTTLHKMKGVLFAVADPTANFIKNGIVGTYNTGSFIANNGFDAFTFLFNGGLHLAKSVGNFASSNLAAVFSSTDSTEENNITNENQATLDLNNIQTESETLTNEINLEQQEEVTPPTPVLNQIPETVIETAPDTTTENPLNINPEVIEVATEPVTQIETNIPVVLGSGGGGGNAPVSNTDTTPPVITITGDNSVDVIKDTTYTDAGATALDDKDGNITIVATGVSDVNTAVIGTYVITYTATDLSNNVAITTRTVNVVADTIAPVITINGNISELILKNSVYIDAGATALDSVNGVVSVTTSGISDINTAIPGTYTVTYSATDLSGNIATKTRTVIVGDGAKLDHPNFVTVSGNYAYVVSENSNSLEIIDVSNPAKLVHKSYAVHRVGDFEMFAPKGVAVSGNYAYVVSNGNTLEIIDISNPDQPIHKSTLNNSDGGAQIVHPNFITISGNYAYIVATGTQNIDIVDISDPTKPVHKSSYWINSLTCPTSIFISGNYMYLTFSVVGSNDGGLQIIDISNPALPVLKSVLNHGTGGAIISNPSSIYISGNYAYVTSRGDNGFEVIDISNIDNPRHVTFIKDGDGGASLHVPTSVVVSGNYAYIALYNGSALEVLDISNPSLPIHKAVLPNNITGASINYANNVFVSGNYAYLNSSLGNALEIVDISNPLVPVHAGKILNGEVVHITTPTILNSEKKIISFDFTELDPDVIGVIDETNHTISLSVPTSTNVTTLSPIFVISNNAASIPTFGESKDFTSPRNYLIFAEDGSVQNYVVTVTIATPPPSPDTIPPSVASYTFNGVASDITVNPTKLNPLSIVINASEKVNWISIKFEKIDDSSIFNIFKEGRTCIDGTDICSKNWDGLLAGDTSAPVGTYKIKVHMKDLANNEFSDYIFPYVIKLDTSII